MTVAAATQNPLGELYQGRTPRRSAGDELVRRRIRGDVLRTGGDDRDLDRDELNELLGYLGFNVWDAMSSREPGPGDRDVAAPRHQAEALGALQCWHRLPAMVRRLTDEIGVDGIVEIGGLSRGEIGSKVNMTHIWASGTRPAFGRGISMGLGRMSSAEHTVDLGDVLQFMRRLSRGLWGGPDEAIFDSMRGYQVPVLLPELITRFQDEATPIHDQELRFRHQRFAADAELTATLMHFDTVGATAQTGRYSLADCGFLMVRDYFLAEDLYHWVDLAEGLPHAVTEVRIFGVDRQLSRAALYVRDRWDTPAGQIRLMDDAELDLVHARCKAASGALRRRIEVLPKRDRITAAAQVYYAEAFAPFARAAGRWEQLRGEFDFYEWDRATSEAYHDLALDGVADELVTRLVRTGEGFPPVPSSPPCDLPSTVSTLYHPRSGAPELFPESEYCPAPVAASAPAVAPVAAPAPKFESAPTSGSVRRLLRSITRPALPKPAPRASSTRRERHAPRAIWALAETRAPEESPVSEVDPVPEDGVAPAVEPLPPAKVTSAPDEVPAMQESPVPKESPAPHVCPGPTVNPFADAAPATPKAPARTRSSFARVFRVRPATKKAVVQEPAPVLKTDAISGAPPVPEVVIVPEVSVAAEVSVAPPPLLAPRPTRAPKLRSACAPHEPGPEVGPKHAKGDHDTVVVVAPTGSLYVRAEDDMPMADRLHWIERQEINVAQMARAYKRFLLVDADMKALVERWRSIEASAAPELMDELAELVVQVKPAVRRASEHVLHFDPFLVRLRRAIARARQGEHEYALGADVESVYSIWQELHQEYRYILTLPSA